MVNKIDASVGTPLWGLNTFRSEILTKLIVDLLRTEKKDFDDDKCKVIRKMLFILLEEINSIPPGSFTRDKLFGELSEFDRIYREWNNIEGDDEFAVQTRKDLLLKLRLQRYRITKIIRLGQLELYNLLDEQLITKIYIGVQDAVTTYPIVFKAMAVAYNRYNRKLQQLKSNS